VRAPFLIEDRTSGSRRWLCTKIEQRKTWDTVESREKRREKREERREERRGKRRGKRRR
jgi:hypothetical protein